MFTFLVVLYVIICLFLILVVLLQQGRGADLAGAFGAGGSQQAFGPRGATTVLHKLTTGFFIAFIVVALLLAVMETRPSTSVIKEGPKNPKAKPAAKLPATFPAPTPPPATTSAAPATATPSAPPATSAAPPTH